MSEGQIVLFCLFTWHNMLLAFSYVKVETTNPMLQSTEWNKRG